MINRKQTQSKKTDFKYFFRICQVFFQVRPKIMWFFYRFTLQGRQKYLTPEIRLKLNDMSDSDYTREKKNMLQTFQKKFKKIIESIAYCLNLNKIPIFDPENKFRIIFNAMILAYNIFYLLIVNFHIVFSADFGHYQHYFHIIALFAWTTEMLMDINTAIYYENEFITDRVRIANIILKKNFFFEIIPLIFESVNSEDKTINIFLAIPILLKIRGMYIITVKLEFFILQQFKKRYLLELFKLIFKLVLMTHVMACTYYLFVQFEKSILGIDGTWLDDSDIIDKGWSAAYAEAQVWAFSTMCNTVSKSLKTTYEYLFTSFWMLISCIGMAYLINKIGEILKELNEQNESYRRDLNLLNQFMNRKKINLGLQRRLNLDLKQQYDQENLKQEIDVKHTLCRLSQPMYKELMKESYKDILNNLPYFCNSISEQSLSKVYQDMEELAFSTNQIIEESEKSIGSSIFIVLKGRTFNQLQFFKQVSFFQINQVFLKVKLNDDHERKGKDFEGQIIKEINPGGSFGLHEFLSGQQREYYAQSEDLSVVVRVDMRKFLEIIKCNETDYQKYQEFRERIIYQIKYEKLQLQCLICNNNDHNYTDCHFTHLVKNNPFIFYKACSSEIQVRDKYDGKRSTKKIHRIYIAVEENEYLNQYTQNYSDHNSYIDNGGFTENNIKYQSSQQIIHGHHQKVNSVRDHHVLPSQNRFMKQISIDNQIQEEETEYDNQTIAHSSQIVGRALNKMKSIIEQTHTPNSKGVDFGGSFSQVRENSEDLSRKKFMFEEENVNDYPQEEKIQLKIQFKPISFQKLAPPSHLKITQRKIDDEEERYSRSSNRQGSVIDNQSPFQMPTRNLIPKKRTILLQDLEVLQNAHHQHISHLQQPQPLPQQQMKHDNQQSYFYAFRDENSYNKLLEWKDSLDYWNFDQMKILKHYFIAGNIDNVLKKYYKFRMRKDRQKDYKGLSSNITKSNISNSKYTLYLTMMQTMKTMKMNKK